MGPFAVCLVSSLLPQGPSTAPVAVPPSAVNPAAWLPAHSSVAVVLPADPSRGYDADAAQRLLSQDPTGMSLLLCEQLQTRLQEQGVAIEDVADLLHGGLGIALHGWSETGTPLLTLVGRCPKRGDALVRAMHERGHAVRVDSVDCYELGGETSPLVGGVFGEHLVLTTNRETLLGTIAATQTDTESSLHHAVDYQQSLRECGDDATQMQVFVRPAQLLTELTARAAGPDLDFGKVGTALELHRVQRAMLGLSQTPHGLVVRGAVRAPGVGGLLAALGGTSIRFDQTLAAIVPDSAIAFGLSTLDLGALVRSGLAVVDAIDADTGAIARQTLDTWGKENGIDVAADLLDTCSGRIATMQLPSGRALAFGVRDQKAWERGIDALLGSQGLKVGTRDIGGATVRCVENQFGSDTLVGMAGDWVCVAQDEASFLAVQQQATSGAVAPGVAAALAAAPEQTTHFAIDLPTGHTVAVLRSEDGLIVTSLQAAPQATAAAVAGHDEVALRALHAAEAAGKAADIAVLRELAGSADVVIARRATWLLGRHADKSKFTTLQDLARNATDAEVRLQAISALIAGAPTGALEVGAEALEDSDVRVRAAGAQLLGRLRNPAGKEPLLAFLQRQRSAMAQAVDTSDVQAALVSLHDLGAKEELLPATATLREVSQSEIGQALAFYWQGVSPQFPREQETTLLLAALDHGALLVRRYAIDRLAELNSTAAVPALEKRLGAEGPELRPLIESTLTYLRRDQEQPQGDEVERAMANAQAMWAKAVSTWNGLDDKERLIYGGGAGSALLVLMIGGLLVRRRRRQQAHEEAAAAAAALTAPSEDYVQEHEATGDYHDEVGAGDEEQVYEDAGTYR